MCSIFFAELCWRSLFRTLDPVDFLPSVMSALTSLKDTGLTQGVDIWVCGAGQIWQGICVTNVYE